MSCSPSQMQIGWWTVHGRTGVCIRQCAAFLLHAGGSTDALPADFGARMIALRADAMPVRGWVRSGYRMPSLRKAEWSAR